MSDQSAPRLDHDAAPPELGQQLDRSSPPKGRYGAASWDATPYWIGNWGDTGLRVVRVTPEPAEKREKIAESATLIYCP